MYWPASPSYARMFSPYSFPFIPPFLSAFINFFHVFSFTPFHLLPSFLPRFPHQPLSSFFSHSIPLFLLSICFFPVSSFTSFHRFLHFFFGFCINLFSFLLSLHSIFSSLSRLFRQPHFYFSVQSSPISLLFSMSNNFFLLPFLTPFCSFLPSTHTHTFPKPQMFSFYSHTCTRLHTPESRPHTYASSPSLSEKLAPA